MLVARCGAVGSTCVDGQLSAVKTHAVDTLVTTAELQFQCFANSPANIYSLIDYYVTDQPKNNVYMVVLTLKCCSN